MSASHCCATSWTFDCLPPRQEGVEATLTVDLYISRQGLLAIVECKSGRQVNQDLRAQIDNLAAKVRKIGARKSIALMCSTAEGLNADNQDGRFLRVYASRMRVGLLLRADIQELARRRDDAQFVTQRLKEWLTPLTD